MTRKLVLHTPSTRHQADTPEARIDELLPAAPARRPSQLIEATTSLVDLEVGHFAVPTDVGELHVPLLLSCRRLARSPEYVRDLKAEITDFAGTSDWLASPHEFDAAGVSELVVQVVDGDPLRVVNAATPVRDKHVVVLTDLAYSSARIRKVVERLEEQGAVWVGVLALVGTEDAEWSKLRLRTLFDLPIASEDGHCRLCDLHVPLVKALGIDEVRGQLTSYDPAVFWMLVDLLPNFTRVGHWRSPRTPNHYWLRILMEDVFKSFGTSMAERILNMLEREAHVHIRWIDCIVAADDPEALLLAEKLKAIYHERPPTVVTVNRQMLKTVSPRELGEDAKAWVAEVHGLVGRRANVVIIDQAAHHLRTYTALKALCDAAEWHTLAFCVVVDRTPTDLRQELHDVRYVSLYRWPFPPHLPSDCTCSLGA